MAKYRVPVEKITTETAEVEIDIGDMDAETINWAQTIEEHFDAQGKLPVEQQQHVDWDLQSVEYDIEGGEEPDPV